MPVKPRKRVFYNVSKTPPNRRNGKRVKARRKRHPIGKGGMGG